jgi:hypothetical protein
MSGTVVAFPSTESVSEAAATSAPPLPIERHIVATALDAERLRSLSEQLLLVLRHAPRDAATFARVQDEVMEAWCDMDKHYRAYQAVLECQGQG